MQHNRVFISYSHHDSDYLERLKVHLKALERDGLIDVWSDKQIKPGDNWRKAIEQALGSASTAILLVSADFLASDFIVNNELPQLLEAAEKRGTRIIPVILKPCAFSRMPELAKFQAINDPSKPIVSMGNRKREEVWDKIASIVGEAVRNVQHETSTVDADLLRQVKRGLDLGEPIPFRIANHFVVSQTGRIIYQVGQRIHHPTFGDGKVIGCRPLQDDQEVTVAFSDDIGIKRLSAKVANMRILSDEGE